MSLNHKLTLFLDLVSLGELFRRHLSRLLLESLDGNDVHFDHFGVKLCVDLYQLIVLEDGLVNLLKQDFDLGVA